MVMFVNACCLTLRAWPSKPPSSNSKRWANTVAFVISLLKPIVQHVSKKTKIYYCSLSAVSQYKAPNLFKLNGYINIYAMGYKTEAINDAPTPVEL